MKIMQMKSLFVALAVVGLSLTVAAEGEIQDQAETLDGAPQNNTWYAQMYYWRGQQLYHGMGCDRDLSAAAEAYIRDKSSDEKGKVKISNKGDGNGKACNRY